VWGGSTEGVHGGPVAVGAGLGSELGSALRRDRERGRKDERLSLELLGGLPRHRLFLLLLLLRSIIAVFILILFLFDLRFVVLVFHDSTDGKVLLFIIFFLFLLDFNILLVFLLLLLFGLLPLFLSFLFLHVFTVLVIFGLNVVSLLLAVLDFHLGRGQHLPQILQRRKDPRDKTLSDTRTMCAVCAVCAIGL
jgi:hypothetical protein